MNRWKTQQLGLVAYAAGAVIGVLVMRARVEVQSAGGMRLALMRHVPWLVTTEWFQPPELPREGDPELTAPPPLEPPDPFAPAKEATHEGTPEVEESHKKGHK